MFALIAQTAKQPAVRIEKLTAELIIQQHNIIPWYDREAACLLLKNCVENPPELYEYSERFGRKTEYRSLYTGTVVEHLNAILGEAFARAEAVALRYPRDLYQEIILATRFDVTPHMAIANAIENAGRAGRNDRDMSGAAALAVVGLWGYFGALLVNWALPL